MKLILSRKGFDSASGGCPSPIFPDGTLYSLPIPHCQSEITYGDLWHGDTSIGEVVADLTRNRFDAKAPAHLDPDINHVAYPRQGGWRPLFGQSRRAQGHLHNQGVRISDLFLFFGLFQKVEKVSGRWCFVKDAPQQHILWGWLQIEEIHKVDELTKAELPWTRYHPHRHAARGKDPTNTLYIASETLNLGDGAIAQGAGWFQKLQPNLVLTQPGKSASYWQLPRCFYPDDGKQPLTGHPRNLWKPEPDNEYAYVQRRGPGQEFVLDLDQYCGVKNWLMESIFSCCWGDLAFGFLPNGEKSWDWEVGIRRSLLQKN